ncbi:MAG: hypothetical protein EPO02_08660 [Nitrospirae bacterium]|nr:MAG: hypothetical protein EPO02_08660 [Nitrospirota bacterium]
MSADKPKKANQDDAPSAKNAKASDPAEEAKRQAYRKLKPVGPIMKPPTPEEIDAFRNDPELKERDHLLDAMPKPGTDDQDPF